MCKITVIVKRSCWCKCKCNILWFLLFVKCLSFELDLFELNDCWPKRHIFFFWGLATLEDMDNGNFHKIMIKRNTGGWVTPNKINISNGYTSSFKTKSKNTLSKAKSHEPFLLFTNLEAWKQGWAGKAFWLPGTGREIENHIPFYGKGTGIRKCYGKRREILVL